MDYSEIYKTKLMSAADVATQVQSGWILGMDAAPTQADGIMDALTEKARTSDIRGVKVHLMLDGYPFGFSPIIPSTER